MQFVSNIYKSVLALLFTGLMLCAVLGAIWAGVNLHYWLFDITLLRYLVPYSVVVLTVILFVCVGNKLKAGLIYGVIFCPIVLGFLVVPPSHDREWREEYAVLPHAVMDEKGVKVHNIRDFEYTGSRDNFTAHYKTVDYDFADLEGVDIVMAHWDDMVMIAHTMMVFRFENAENLVVSIETRREADEPWNITRGFFNQYELIYLLTTERDSIGRRISVSNHDLFLYPTTLDKTASKELLQNVIAEVNGIYEQPKFYNTFWQNCTSSLFEVSRRPELFDWFNPQLLLSGVSDRYAHKVGLLDAEGSYWQVKQNHYISNKVKKMSPEQSLSAVIR